MTRSVKDPTNLARVRATLHDATAVLGVPQSMPRISKEVGPCAQRLGDSAFCEAGAFQVGDSPTALRRQARYLGRRSIERAGAEIELSHLRRAPTRHGPF